MPAPAIEYRDVTFARPGGARILHHFNLTLASGDVLALVGRSGAGKTTLLKLVNRLLLPDEGVVFVEGRDTRDWDPVQLRRRVGYVLQEVGLFPHMNVADNVSVSLRLAGWDAPRRAARVGELLGLVGLDPALSARWPDELSGGQRQRVAIARALALDPPMLLMDEPFGALDPVTRVELHAEFRGIQSRLRKTIVIVTSPASGMPAAPTDAMTLVITTSICCCKSKCIPSICATNSAAMASYSAVPSLLKLAPTIAPRLADFSRIPTWSRRHSKVNGIVTVELAVENAVSNASRHPFKTANGRTQEPKRMRIK